MKVGFCVLGQLMLSLTTTEHWTPLPAENIFEWSVFLLAPGWTPWYFVFLTFLFPDLQFHQVLCEAIHYMFIKFNLNIPLSQEYVKMYLNVTQK